MSSLEIARLTEKGHDKILVDIRKMLDELEIGHAVFSDSYKSNQNKMLPCFNLPRRECDILISGYSIKYRAAIVDRWQELEKLQSKLPNFEDPAEAAIAWAEQYKEKKIAIEKLDAAKSQIEADRPKVEFAESVRNTDAKISVGDFAKLIGTGQNRLFALLREDGYLMANNRPYQRYIDRELLVSVEQKPYKDGHGNEHVAFKTMITGKGQVYFEKKYRAILVTKEVTQVQS